MPFPLLAVAMLASTAASVGGGIMAGNKADKQAGMNNRIASDNQFQSGVDREASILSAMRRDMEDKLGSTDAMGNRTKWVPGRGWVTEASEAVQGNIDAGLREQYQQLTHDASRNRANADRVSDNARDSSMMFDTFMRELSQTAGTRIDPNQRFMQNLADQTTGFNQGFDDAQEAYATQALRTGSATGANAMADFAKQRGEGLAGIHANARTGARTDTRAEFDSDRGRASSLAGGFLDAAGSAPIGAPGTSGIERGANAGLGLASNRGAQNNALLAAAMGAPTPQHPGVTLGNGASKALIGAGAEIGSLGHGLGAAGIEGFGDGKAGGMDLLKLMQMMGAGG